MTNCKLRKYTKAVKKRVLVAEARFEKKGGYIVEDIVVDILSKFYFINSIEFGIFLDKEDKEIVKALTARWDSASAILLLQNFCFGINTTKTRSAFLIFILRGWI